MSSNLPPGVTDSMIPGNRPEDAEFDAKVEKISDRLDTSPSLSCGAYEAIDDNDLWWALVEAYDLGAEDAARHVTCLDPDHNSEAGCGNPLCWKFNPGVECDECGRLMPADEVSTGVAPGGCETTQCVDRRACTATHAETHTQPVAWGASHPRGVRGFCNRGGCKDSFHVGGNYGSEVCYNPEHH